MKKQHQIVVSIGSNVGNRLENLTQAIHLVHEQVASVVKVSPLYETPAWGFESAAFYNGVVVLHSYKSPQKILAQLLKIEKQMGRVRTQDKGYQARIIDLDIISYDEEQLATDTLQIPHPQLQHRNFVLLPLKDIVPNWVHPVLKKSVAELLATTSDTSVCTKVYQLVSPVESLGLQQYNYIAIEGNIGAGKTTLATKIAEDCNAKLVLERFADNPFLPKFYKDQNRYAFPLEMSFLADRYQQLTDDLAQFDLFKDFIVADYHIFKSLIFAKVTLQEDEFRLYKTMFDIIHRETAKPDLYIYLYQNTERLLANIKKRGRSYEQEIPAEYLEKINRGYLDYIKTQTDLNVLVIDVSDLDFVKRQEDYVFLLARIKEKLG
ncbi:2-amino-4-hydroxy-6-hydroxymethyldihydropteridine diphosphokinase [Flavobacterium sp. TP390]|uniref:2-amino-4-hydroxy-6-hydroxymethyldihydropteridine pyrophosphokinase n=1 Tax=Flavobacterium profundi TaxID=1774945 RepID=A0A6I4IKG4_9FLAO|nr:2-amino-4-hydroxy-6-hydroxymethyldihydropteridine diphosphokinase [Flavobacterium profundi]MVO08789.1 2-amino-4-hydroxy-6-hydroxymethyldihydropteridine diphosphokinase [Flavobacterium profundi]